MNELMQFQDELMHFGIKGMHWGVRRYQNPDGTLTPAGKKHYLKEFDKETTRNWKQDRRDIKEIKKNYKGKQRDNILNQQKKRIEDRDKKRFEERSDFIFKNNIKTKDNISYVSEEQLKKRMERLEQEKQYYETMSKVRGMKIPESMNQNFGNQNNNSNNNQQNGKKDSKFKKAISDVVVNSGKAVGGSILTYKLKEFLGGKMGASPSFSSSKEKFNYIFHPSALKDAKSDFQKEMDAITLELKREQLKKMKKDNT